MTDFLDTDGVRYGPLTPKQDVADFFADAERIAKEATIRRGEAIRDALMMAPLQHFFIDTVTNHAGFWVARCNCGYTTLGYATPENAQMSLDRFHTGRAR